MGKYLYPGSLLPQLNCEPHCEQVEIKTRLVSQTIILDLTRLRHASSSHLCIVTPPDKREDKADTLIIIEPVAVVDKTVNVVSLVVIDVNLPTKIVHESDIESEVHKVNQSHKNRPMTSSKLSNGISKTVGQHELR